MGSFKTYKLNRQTPRETVAGGTRRAFRPSPSIKPLSLDLPGTRFQSRGFEGSGARIYFLVRQMHVGVPEVRGLQDALCPVLRAVLAITQERRPVPDSSHPRDLQHHQRGCQLRSIFLGDREPHHRFVRARFKPRDPSDFSLSTRCSLVSYASPPVSCSSRRVLDLMHFRLPQTCLFSPRLYGGCPRGQWQPTSRRLSLL